MRRSISSCIVTAVVMLIAGSILQPTSYLQAIAQAQQGNCQTFSETGKTVCGRFLQYWQQHGGLAQQGYPISKEFIEVSDLNGKQYTVQYFERAVFEMHPENAAPSDVLLSQLGTFRFKAKYPNGEPGSPPPPAPPPSLGATVPLRDGVTITFADKVGDFKTGATTICAGDRVFMWVFEVKNSSNTPFILNVGKDNAIMSDSTGKKYEQESGCNSFAADFPGPVTMSPGESKVGVIIFRLGDVPGSAIYLDLHVTITGTPLTFRYPLK